MDSDPDDLFEGADDNYMPESEEDDSLGTEDFIVPEDPFKQEHFRRCLVAMARSLKRKQQLLQENTDALNEKWVEVLSAEQDMENRRHSAPKSYPRRRLLPEFDEELADDLDRPPRGRDSPRQEDTGEWPPPRRHGKDPMDYLDPCNARHRIEENRAPPQSIYGSRGRSPAGPNGYDA